MILRLLASGVVNGDALNFAANAYSSSMFYVISYVLTTLASFGVLLLLSQEGFESEEIADLAGLNQRSPLYAAVMAVCLLSLAGIPPMVGFYAKLSVLQALLASGQVGSMVLAVFAVLMSLIGAFYYLRVIKVMYFDVPITASTVVVPERDDHARDLEEVRGGRKPEGALARARHHECEHQGGDRENVEHDRDLEAAGDDLLVDDWRNRTVERCGAHLLSFTTMRPGRRTLRIDPGAGRRKTLRTSGGAAMKSTITDWMTSTMSIGICCEACMV